MASGNDGARMWEKFPFPPHPQFGNSISNSKSSNVGQHTTFFLKMFFYYGPKAQVIPNNPTNEWYNKQTKKKFKNHFLAKKGE